MWSASSCHCYGFRSKKSLEVVSQNRITWHLLCPYTDGGCATRLGLSPMAFPNALENSILSSVTSLYFGSSVLSFSAGFSFRLRGLSHRLPYLSSPPPSTSLATRSRVPPAAPCIVGGGRAPPPPPPHLALASGVGFECLPFTWPIKEVTTSVNSAMWLSCISLASLFASNSAIITLSILSWFSSAC